MGMDARERMKAAKVGKAGCFLIIAALLNLAVAFVVLFFWITFSLLCQAHIGFIAV